MLNQTTASTLTAEVFFAKTVNKFEALTISKRDHDETKVFYGPQNNLAQCYAIDYRSSQKIKEVEVGCGL